MYIEKPNKIEVKNAATNPPIQRERVLESGTKFIPVNTTGCLPHRPKAVEAQKQLSKAPVTWKKQTNRMPIAETIATHFPSHRQIMAPAFW